MRIKLIDVDNRLSIKYNPVDGIFNYGDDNCYPSLVKSIINSSVTARNCVKKNALYTYGKGFEFVESVTDKTTLIVNKKGHNINELLRIVTREFAEQNNVFLHINYNSLFEITSVELLPTTDVRIGKSDSTSYSGKFLVYNNWDRSKSKKCNKNDYNLIDRFNPSPLVIQSQVDAVGGIWNKYKGQILHLTSDFSDTYSLSDVDSVMKDADSQYKAAELRNDVFRKGFAGVKLVVSKPLKGGREEGDELAETLSELKGSSGILYIEADEESTDLTQEILIQNLDSDVDSNSFIDKESIARKNILEAFGVPSILISQDSDAVFGNSGELLTQAKLMFWDDKSETRNIITEAFEKLFSKFHQVINPSNNWNIIPIVTKPEVTNE